MVLRFVVETKLKTCSVCEAVKLVAEFPTFRNKRKSGEIVYNTRSWCILCERIRTRNWNKARREKALSHYGHKCACCAEIRSEFLSIGHINGGGAKHRTEINKSIIGWLFSNNFPEGFRLLCHNCNQCLGFYGYCVHQLERGEFTQEEADKLSPRIGHGRKVGFTDGRKKK